MNWVMANRRKIPPTTGSFRIAASSQMLSGVRLEPAPGEEAPAADGRHDHEEIVPQERRDPEHDDGQQRQLGVEVREELGEARDDERHQDRDQHARERDQDDGIDERRDDLARQRDDRLLVLEVTAQDRLDLARLLARLQRRPVEAREEVAFLGEGLGDRGARVDALAHVGQHAAQDRALLALEQDLEGAHDRQARLQQGDQLLVEDQEVRHLDAAALGPGLSAREREPLAADLEDVAAPALDLEPRGAEVGRDHGLLGDRAVRPAGPDPELAHGFFSTVVAPGEPFPGASPRGTS